MDLFDGRMMAEDFLGVTKEDCRLNISLILCAHIWNEYLKPDLC